MDAGQPHGERARVRLPDADEALEAALWALRRWAELVGVDAIRVIGPLAGPVAALRTCALLGLRAATSDVGAGRDALDEAGLTYRISARAVTARGDTSFDLQPAHEFDRALLVLYDPPDLTLVEVWRLDREAVLAHADVDRDRLELRWPASRQYAKLQYARDIA